MLDENLFRSEELAVFHLRDLYRRYGYLPYRMSKFEEYELYVRNKDFLVSDRVITFNDTNGKLLALKPDVTLSIIRGGEDAPGTKQKVYYNENVYRVSERTHRFKRSCRQGWNASAIRICMMSMKSFRLQRRAWRRSRAISRLRSRIWA